MDKVIPNQYLQLWLKESQFVGHSKQGYTRYKYTFDNTVKEVYNPIIRIYFLDLNFIIGKFKIEEIDQYSIVTPDFTFTKTINPSPYL